MHVISRKKLKEAAMRHPDLEAALDAWFRIAKRAVWRDLTAVRMTLATPTPLRNVLCSTSKETNTV
jgi:mRNA-degrading endonuclease HigB of HigAB toxin-antitoxin module